MFDTTRYSLARYSLGSQYNTYEIEETFSESLNSLAGIAIQVSVKEKFSDAFSGQIQGTMSIITKLAGDVVLGHACQARANVIKRFRMGETVNAAVYGNKVISAVGSFLETMDGVWEWSKNVMYSDGFFDEASWRIRGTIAVVTTLAGNAVLENYANMSANVVKQYYLDETLDCVALASKDIHTSYQVVNTMSVEVWASKNIPYDTVLEDGLGQYAYGSKNVETTVLASDALYTVTVGTSQITQTATFSVSIPAGGELRIDSDIFAVYLNGENALHTQSGDWITISPNLLRISIESATGGTLAGQLIYTERFL